MRLLIIVGCLALALVTAMVVMVIVDDDTPPTRTSAQEVAKPEQKSERDRPPARKPDRRKSRRKSGQQSHLKGRDEPRQALEKDTVQRFGQEFERKWLADRERLGEERHKKMEQLWFDGRRPRGDRESMDQLEELLKEFPDSNRAGCAAMELGHHYVRSRDLDLKERVQKARKYWHMVDERYSDTLCEYNAPAAGLSKLGLATWVYRKEDPAMARRLLEEIIAKHKGETDHLGRPLADSARRLLKGL